MELISVTDQVISFIAAYIAIFIVTYFEVVLAISPS